MFIEYKTSRKCRIAKCIDLKVKVFVLFFKNPKVHLNYRIVII